MPVLGRIKTPDIFYGWVVVLTSSMCLLLAYVMWHTWSVFFVAILREFQWNRADTSLAFSVASVMTAIASPLAGGLIDRFTVRRVMPVAALVLATGMIAMSMTQEKWHLYLSYGVLVGLGMVAVGTVPNYTVIQNWFRRNRGLAMGSASAGIGLGMLLIVPATQSLIEGIGWRKALWVLAGLIAVGIPTLVLLFQRQRPEDMGLRPDGATSDTIVKSKAKPTGMIVDAQWAAKDWTWQEAMRTHRYWGLFFACFVGGWGVQTLLSHMVAALVDVGYAASTAAWVYGLVGITGSFGKFFWGAISDRVGREEAALAGAASAALGIFLLMQIHDTSRLPLLIVFVGIYGLGYGSVPPMRPSIVADIFQGKGFGAIYGSTYIASGLGGLIGPWLAGYLFDTMGTYQLAFTLSMVGYLLCSVGYFLAGPRKVRLVPGKSQAAC